jgi:hypothetical protein
MLLCFVVSERGIEANPKKISGIMDMGPIKNLKGVQRATGCLAALSHFIARLGERSLPLYKQMNVTEPPKIVPYYRLSRSTWPLSNNKELFCRFRRVKPDKSHTTGSLICDKPTRRRDQSTTLHYIKDSQV